MPSDGEIVITGPTTGQPPTIMTEGAAAEMLEIDEAQKPGGSNASAADTAAVTRRGTDANPGFATNGGSSGGNATNARDYVKSESSSARIGNGNGDSAVSGRQRGRPKSSSAKNKSSQSQKTSVSNGASIAGIAVASHIDDVSMASPNIDESGRDEEDDDIEEDDDKRSGISSHSNKSLQPEQSQLLPPTPAASLPIYPPAPLSLSSEELNFLIYRYLQECGFVHSAFTFAHESGVGRVRPRNSASIPPGALVLFLQKGLQYVGMEESLMRDLRRQDQQQKHAAVGSDDDDTSNSNTEKMVDASSSMGPDFSLLCPRALNVLTRHDPPIKLRVPPAAAAAATKAMLEIEEKLTKERRLVDEERLRFVKLASGKGSVGSLNQSLELRGGYHANVADEVDDQEPAVEECDSNPSPKKRKKKKKGSNKNDSVENEQDETVSNKKKRTAANSLSASNNISMEFDGMRQSMKKKSARQPMETSATLDAAAVGDSVPPANKLAFDSSVTSIPKNQLPQQSLQTEDQINAQHYQDAQRIHEVQLRMQQEMWNNAQQQQIGDIDSRGPPQSYQSEEARQQRELQAAYAQRHRASMESFQQKQIEQTNADVQIKGTANFNVTNAPSLLPRSNNDASGSGPHSTAVQGNQPATSIIEEEDRLTAIHPSEVMELSQHTSEVFMCAWNPRFTNLIATGSGDASARIWTINGPDTNGGGQSILLPHGQDSNDNKNKDVTTLEWSTSGELLATGSYDGVARVWFRNGELRQTLKGHRGPIFSLKWNKRGNFLLSGSYDKSTIVWDVTGEVGFVKQQFTYHLAPALDVDWKDDMTFASCSTDKTVQICRVGLARPIKTYTGHTDEVNAVKWDPSGTLLASCSDDCTAKVWDINSPSDEPKWNFKSHQQEIYTVKWSPTGPGSKNPNKLLLLATASFDGSVRLWNVDNGTCLRVLSRHRESVYSVAFSPSGDYLASGSLAGQLYIWNVRDGTHIKSFKGKGDIFEVAWNIEESRVAACFSSNVVSVIDFKKT